MTFRTLIHLALVAGLACGLARTVSAATEPAGDPGQPVDQLHTTLLELMRRAEELGYEGRYDRVSPVVYAVFDIEFMARIVVGPYWKSFDEDQQRRWIETFGRFTISNFAHRFDGYSGEQFENRGRRPASRETVVVQTTLIRPNDEDVDLHYRMRESEGEWRVVDIYSDGKVSELALRRSEYAAVLKRDGIEALIDALNGKISRRADVASSAPCAMPTA